MSSIHSRAAAAAEDETAFPRGGNLHTRGGPSTEGTTAATTTTTSNVSTSSATSKKKRNADFLFGNNTHDEEQQQQQSKRHKRQRRQAKTTSTSATTATTTGSSLLPLGGGGVVQPQQSSSNHRKEAYIEALSFSKLGARGGTTKLLGVVKEVHDDYAIVSLPNLLNGYILKRNKDPFALQDSLFVGQVLGVVVVKVATESIPQEQQRRQTWGAATTRKRIQVSALPASWNSPLSTETCTNVPFLRGRITSIEDHGCLVDLGHARKGFLAFQDVEGDYRIVDTAATTKVATDSDNNKEEDKDVRLLNPGRLYDFCIKDDNSSASASASANHNKTVLPLTLPTRHCMAHKTVGDSSSSSSTLLTLQSLQPGMLVIAKVEALARNGLCVTFLGNAFRGAIEMSHLGGIWIPSTKQQEGSKEWKEQVFGTNNGSSNSNKLLYKFPARILAVDAVTKLVRLTLLPHLLDLNGGLLARNERLPQVGSIVENAVVVRLDPGVGASLALPPSEEDDDDDDSNEQLDVPIKLWSPFKKNESYVKASKVKTAYVHISKATDGRTPEVEFSKTFAPSTTHTLRILNTSHWLDGVATCATADSIVQAHVLTHADLEPGKVYRNVQVCGQLDGGSVMVDFGMGIRGLIPQMHLFDHSVTSEFRSRLRKEKYAVGSKVDVRCLSVDATHKRCLVTAKKSLLKASDSALTSYENARPGDTVTGFISKIDADGLYVTFYNRIYGKATARSLAAELGVEDHRADYHVGDVVQCRIINCKKRSNKRHHLDQWDLNLSLDLKRDEQDDDDQEMEDAAAVPGTSRLLELKAGSILPEKCMRVVELVDSIPKEDRAYIPGHAIVRIKSKFIFEDTNSSTLPHVECKLPFDQLKDSYSEKDIESAESLDRLGRSMLTVGKKVDCKGLILADPKKSTDEYASGLGRLPIVSLRPKLVATADATTSSTRTEVENSYAVPLLPDDDTHLFMGAFVQGYVTQVNPRHGSFVRFLNRVTGLVPKVKKGLNLPKYGTVTCRIVALDVSSSPPKILLTLASSKDKRTTDTKKADSPRSTIKPGDVVDDAVVTDCNFLRARLKLGENHKSIRARVHVTMAEAPLLPVASIGSDEKMKKKLVKDSSDKITKHHPFYRWKKGTKVSGLTCVAVDVRDGVSFVELASRDICSSNPGPSGPSTVFLESASELFPGMKVLAVITAISHKNSGVWVQMSPGISGFIPALEISTDAFVLNNLAAYYPLGGRVECRVMEMNHWAKNKRSGHKTQRSNHVQGSKEGNKEDLVYLSLLRASTTETDDAPLPVVTKPLRGDLIIGRVNRTMQLQRAPALMLDLRGGFVGRCCITEVDELDEWINMPLGRMNENHSDGKKGDQNVVTDEEHDDAMKVDEEGDGKPELSSALSDSYPHGLYIQCRVLAGVPSEPMVEVSLRPSRLEGDLDEDELPAEKDVVQGYVVNTNRMGCFVRLSRQAEGRVILKELCDGFLHDPVASFPMGRLIVGKVKSIQEQKSGKKKKTKGFVKSIVDLDMRESTLLESQDKLEFDDIELHSKHKAVVTRLESYGVFVRLESSEVSGLVHKSECSDKYIKNLADLYDPGDLVKVLVVKKDSTERKIGFSMKASHFEDDEDSDDDSMIDDDSDSGSNEAMDDSLVSVDGDDTGDEIDSDDENFASRLAAKMETEGEEGVGMGKQDSMASISSSDSDSDDSTSEDDDGDIDEDAGKLALDTNVGFDWEMGGATRTKPSKADSSDDSSDDESDGPTKTSRKSKQRTAARRREEQEISRRETALADGTADENPESAADFERLLASDPNSSEHWIRYMAFHLSLADVASARSVAHRAFDRIEFRQEGEKLNVWTALLTLELKYGTAKGFQGTIDDACQHNNPKQVYLRVCEILEKEVEKAPSSTEAVSRADDMYRKMCKKFKSKKTVWLKHFHYLLGGGRSREAHALLKRALASLPEYKHVETTSKFAQLEMEHGSMERGRTIMDGLLSKYPRRLDLLFVYVDKEVKHGELDAARALFARDHKLKDKQMKSLFKKWYRVEEEHGTEESREHVKDAARAYVERSSK